MPIYGIILHHNMSLHGVKIAVLYLDLEGAQALPWTRYYHSCTGHQAKGVNTHGKSVITMNIYYFCACGCIVLNETVLC